MNDSVEKEKSKGYFFSKPLLVRLLVAASMVAAAAELATGADGVAEGSAAGRRMSNSAITFRS